MRSVQSGSHRVAAPVEIRELTRSELARVGEIDRSERIDVLFEQRGTELVMGRGNLDAPAWDPQGLGEHSAYLHVSRSFRSTGIGSRLCADLESIARRAGDTCIVVTATPSENTVRFYLGRGYRPMAQPLAELFALEPEDIHMARKL